MKTVPVRYSILIALLLATGCQGGGGAPSAAMPIASKPTSPVSGSCERGCNSEYDACMDRFSGVSGGPGLGQHQDSAMASLGPNDVCPDQLKSCLRRCAP